jgi:hypothetical protein
MRVAELLTTSYKRCGEDKSRKTMKRALVLKPFITDKNEIVLNGDTVYIAGRRIFFNRVYLGNFMEGDKFDEYLEIKKEF